MLAYIKSREELKRTLEDTLEYLSIDVRSEFRLLSRIVYLILETKDSELEILGNLRRDSDKLKELREREKNNAYVFLFIDTYTSRERKRIEGESEKVVKSIEKIVAATDWKKLQILTVREELKELFKKKEEHDLSLLKRQQKVETHQKEIETLEKLIKELTVSLSIG